jgi:hypothetical protein
LKQLAAETFYKILGENTSGSFKKKRKMFWHSSSHLLCVCRGLLTSAQRFGEADGEANSGRGGTVHG